MRFFGSVLFGTLFSIAVCGLNTANAIAPIPGDYDGDGKTDFVLGEITLFGTSTFYKGSFSTGGTGYVSFNVRADAYVPGHYFGERFDMPAIVNVRQSNAPLEWYLWLKNQPTQIRFFGMPGDTPVQGDYDCDGKTDLAVRTLAGDYGIWKILKSSNNQEVQIPFGLKGDRVFGADINGDGCSELFTLRLVSGQIHWFFRSLSSEVVQSVNWGLEGDIPLRPVDLNGDGGGDFIAVRTVKKDNQANIAYSNGVHETRALGKANSVPLTGKFGSTVNLAYWNRSKGMLSVIQPDNSLQAIAFGGSADTLIRPDGSVVLPGTFDRMVKNAVGNIACDINRPPQDGRAGYVHNPNNSRRTIKAVLPPEWTFGTASVKVYGKGKLFDTLRYASGFEYGGRERWYGKYSPGAYPKNLLEVITLKDGRNICIKIPDPTRRYD